MRGMLWLSIAMAACGDPAGPGGPQQPTSCDDADRIDAWDDADADGAGDPATKASVCALGPGQVDNGDDCDDADPARSPLASEVCDGVDNDCDTEADDGLPQTTWYADADADGFGDPTDAEQGCDQPPGTVENDLDCDDEHADANPDGIEVCDGYDNDCDFGVDDVDGSLTGATTWYRDADGDGFGTDDDVELACESPGLGQYSLVGGDCDDAERNAFPGQTEICNRIDDNCDLLIDEDDPLLDWATADTFFVDGDLDGVGDALQPVDACFADPGQSPLGGDCDDADPTIGAAPLWVVDADRDGYGFGAPLGAATCTQPQPDAIPDGGPDDCNDGEPAINPAAAEICNAVDDDCDGQQDDADPDVDLSTGTLYFRDQDGDGFGREPGTLSCDNPNPAVFVEQGGDCDDRNGLGFPGAVEVCDAVDNDCDLLVDEDDPSLDLASLIEHWEDLDLDGVGNAAVPILACGPSTGIAAVAGDCDDLDDTLGAPALWQVDADQDGVGAGPALGPESCTPPQADAVAQGPEDDCADGDPLIHPGAAEVCADGIDQDCTGADQACGPVGSFHVADGPAWGNNPPVFTCLDVCAMLFGGVATDWQCSTSSAFIDNQAYFDGWGDGTGCTVPGPEDYSFEQVAVPGYDCGFAGCSYSAYVLDHCSPALSENFCWQ